MHLIVCKTAKFYILPKPEIIKNVKKDSTRTHKNTAALTQKCTNNFIKYWAQGDSIHKYEIALKDRQVKYCALEILKT